MAIKLSELRIDNASLGSDFLFAGVSENYEYVNGNKGKMIGFKYDVILPAHNMEKLSVKIENVFDKFDVAPLSHVEFADLVVVASAYQDKVNYRANAKAIKLVGSNAPVKDSTAKA